MNAKQYKNKLLKGNFNNRATFVSNTDEEICHNCAEPLVFALTTEKGENFSLGLSTILQCLRVAEEQEVVPKIDENREFESTSWWLKIKQMYGEIK